MCNLQAIYTVRLHNVCYTCHGTSLAKTLMPGWFRYKVCGLLVADEVLRAGGAGVALEEILLQRSELFVVTIDDLSAAVGASFARAAGALLGHGCAAD